MTPLGTHHWCQDSWFPDRTRPGWQGVGGVVVTSGVGCSPAPASALRLRITTMGGRDCEMERVDVEGTGEGPTDSFAFISFPNLRISLISEFGGGTGWTLYPSLSTSFMNVSPSSTGNLIFGFTTWYIFMSYISELLDNNSFLRSYYLILSFTALFPLAFLFTVFMLFKIANLIWHTSFNSGWSSF